LQLVAPREVGLLVYGPGDPTRHIRPLHGSYRIHKSCHMNGDSVPIAEFVPLVCVQFQ
jgi:hypothetical protein